MKIPIPGRHGGWWLGISWQKKSKWKYFKAWIDGPMRSIWLGHLCIEWWWR